MGTGVKKRCFNSWEMKFKLVNYYYGRYCLVVTEHVNQSDVFVVRNSGYCLEIEVKVNKADLLGEIKVIKRSNGSLNWYELGSEAKGISRSKYDKHKQYLNNPEKTPKNWYDVKKELGLIR